jgi:hypothetical protein
MQQEYRRAGRSHASTLLDVLAHPCSHGDHIGIPEAVIDFGGGIKAQPCQQPH